MIHKWEKWLISTYRLNTLDKNEKNKTRNSKFENDKIVKIPNKWSINNFPQSKILAESEDTRNENVLFKRYGTFEEMDIDEIADTLHNLDLKLYGRILPTELVKWGSENNKLNRFCQKQDTARENLKNMSIEQKSNKSMKKTERNYNFSNTESELSQDKNNFQNNQKSCRTIYDQQLYDLEYTYKKEMEKVSPQLQETEKEIKKNIEYNIDGSSDLPLHFKHILIKNKAITKLTDIKIRNGIKKSFFERICEKLKLKGNYNSYLAMMNGINKNNKSNNHNIRNILSDKNHKLTILPFENILMDVAISNQQPHSQQASIFFYQIIKFFISLQEHGYHLDDYLEHSILREMVSLIDQKDEKIKRRKIIKGVRYFIN